MHATTSLTVRIPPDLHQQIKTRAAEKGVSLNEWVVRALTYQYQRSVQGAGAKITTEVTL